MYAALSTPPAQIFEDLRRLGVKIKVVDVSIYRYLPRFLGMAVLVSML